VKLNLLLFAGENEETLRETHAWLEQHRSLFKGISIGPVLAFGWPHRSANFIAQLKTLGERVNVEASRTGITKFDLSPSLSLEDAERFAKAFAQEFMKTDDYFYLKAFSYFPRSYTREEFLFDLRENKCSAPELRL